MSFGNMSSAHMRYLKSVPVDQYKKWKPVRFMSMSKKAQAVATEGHGLLEYVTGCLA